MQKELATNISQFFDHTRNETSNISQLAGSFLSDKSNRLYVFGGMIRDIYLFSIEHFHSDIDLVYSGSQAQLIEILSQTNIKKLEQNKFGGFRFTLDGWDIDIWPIRNTWALTEGYVDYDKITDLLKTTFMSWDAVLYDVKESQFICDDDYFINLNQRHLDLCLLNTPNEIGAYTRLMRTIIGKNVNSISDTTKSILINYKTKYHINELIDYEAQSFTKPLIDLMTFNKIFSKYQL